MSVRVLPALVLVLADGSTPASATAPAPFVQTITLPQFDNAEQPYQLFQANGTPVDTTGGAFVLTARSGPWNAPMMSRQGVVVDDPTGKGKFIIGSSDTGIARGGYPCDVEYIDAAGNRWQVMPPDPVLGNLIITEALSTPTQTVTPGPGQIPIGSAVGHSDTRSDFPAASLHPWLFWIADDMNLAYYSDGTAWHAVGSGLAPTVLGTLKNTAEVGDTITVRGTGFDAVKQVLFGGVSAVFTVVNSTTITATVPGGAATGMLQLLANGDAIDVGAFCVLSAASNLELSIDLPAMDPRVLVDQAHGGLQLVTTNAQPTGPLAQMVVTSGKYPPNLGYDYTIRFPWKGDAPLANVYITSAASTDGAHAIYVDASGNLQVEIKGSSSLSVGYAMPYVAPGSEIEMRYVYDAVNTGDNLLYFRINGAYIHNPETRSLNLSTGPTGLATPTAFYLGSNTGATPLPDPPTYLKSLSRAHVGDAAVEIVMIGDSLMDAGSGGRQLVAGSIYYPEERWTRGGIMSIALGGATIADEQGYWSTNQYFGAASVKAFCALIGINDIAENASAATVLASLNTLTAYLKTNNPEAKVLLSTLLPARGLLTAPQFAVWQAVNAGIVGGTVTNVDLIITAASAAMDDGTGGIKEIFDYGDQLHENNFGRDVLAQAFRDGLVSLGVLP